MRGAEEGSGQSGAAGASSKECRGKCSGGSEGKTASGIMRDSSQVQDAGCQYRHTRLRHRACLAEKNVDYPDKIVSGAKFQSWVRRSDWRDAASPAGSVYTTGRIDMQQA
jgi:hypothetical protein